MVSETALFTLLYTVVSLCVLVPPTEFISAGFTIQQLLGHFLGGEDVNFVEYHIKGTTLTMVAHSLLPLGYFFCFPLFVESFEEQKFWQEKCIWEAAVGISVVFPTVIIMIALYWAMEDWKHHPAVKVLAQYGQPWRVVAARIDMEFRRVDKFASGTGTMTRVIVTDSWIIKTTPYRLFIIQQSDTSLTLTESSEHALSHVSNTGIQFLTIHVNSHRDHVPSFDIRVNSQEYNDLRDKLQAPLENARNVVVHRTLSDRFLEAFRAIVEQNSKYPVPPDIEIDSCLGCMQVPACVKLQKLCDDPLVGECQQCFCRPMWCLDCMGKWFASRQNQNRPETWLQSRCPCPSCRSLFCMVDVCLVE